MDMVDVVDEMEELNADMQRARGGVKGTFGIEGGVNRMKRPEQYEQACLYYLPGVWGNG